MLSTANNVDTFSEFQRKFSVQYGFMIHTTAESLGLLWVGFQTPNEDRGFLSRAIRANATDRVGDSIGTHWFE